MMRGDIDVDMVMNDVRERLRHRQASTTTRHANLDRETRNLHAARMDHVLGL